MKREENSSTGYFAESHNKKELYSYFILSMQTNCSSIHQQFSTRVQRLIHRHPHKGCQLHQMTICSREKSVFGFTSKVVILICLVSHKKGRDFCWKEQQIQLKRQFNSPPTFSKIFDFEIARRIEKIGEYKLKIEWKNEDQALILSFANQQIQGKWMDILTQAQKNKILKGVQNLMEESVIYKTQKTNQNSSFVSSQVGSLIDLDELQNELTINRQLSLDEIKAKLTKLMTTQTNTEKIVNLVVDTLKFHFDAQLQLKELKEDSKKESFKLAEMQKQLIQVKDCKSSLESEVVDLKEKLQRQAQKQIESNRQKSQILSMVYQEKRSGILEQDDRESFDEVDRGFSSEFLEEINESLNGNREHQIDCPNYYINNNSTIFPTIILVEKDYDVESEEFDNAREALMKKDKDNAVGFAGCRQQA